MTTKSKRVNAVGAKSVSEDSRLRKDAGAEVRGSRSQADAPRVNDEGTALTVEQRMAQLIRNEFKQEALPSIPPRPGWHRCWLTTSSSYDPIHKRMRLGYTPVKADSIPGFESMRMKSGEFEGCISCNEMLLFEIPEELFQAIMQEFHHNQPLEQEEALKQQLIREEEDSQGKKLGEIPKEADGFRENNFAVRKRGQFASL